MEILSLHRRWMIRRDWPDVLNIDAMSYDVPWTENDFMQQLKRRNVIANVIEAVVNGRGRIIGFLVRAQMSSAIKILRLAVDPEFRRQGVAGMLVNRAKDLLHRDRRILMTALVPERNLIAQLFFRSQGFLCTRTLQIVNADYYSFQYRCQL